MNLQEAIAAAQASGLDNAAVLADFIRTQGADLSSTQEQVRQITEERDRLTDNNSTLLGQKRRAKEERDQWQQKYQAVASQFLQEGDDEEAADKRLSDLAAEVEQLRTAKADAESARDEALKAAGDLQSEVTLRDVSQHLGVSAVLLKRLIPVEASSYVIEGDDVHVLTKEGETEVKKPWSEVLEAQDPAIQQALQGTVTAPTTTDEPATPTSRPPRRPSAPPTQPSKEGVKVDTTLGNMGFKGPGVSRKES
jgi:hypothetical protein